ncbi:MAG: carboxypeptidase regulatory-like domain-containing protein [Planctomycetes bacterium]|nr:carboxypeptidase regulatory-like domain-containing protein [Planctomycetota bacterium]MCB9884490.1 carboxypeptidase regulatory-like domain-containing protein [Planctomycetota bacterium]
MSDRAWQRPSLVVVGAATLWLGVFAATGHLRLDPEPAEVGANRSAQASTEQAPEPTVVHVGRPAPVAPRLQVRGTVLDAAGFLIAGAEVGGPQTEPVRTDAAGQFVLSLPSPPPQSRGVGAFDVLLSANGQRPQWVRGSLLAPDRQVFRMAPSAPWDERPQPQHEAAPQLFGEGSVRGADGSPLAGAYVTVKDSGVWAQTDEIGRYTLPLPDRACVIVVHHPEAGGDGHGLAVRSEPFKPQRSQGIVPLPELIAEPASMLRGRVADSSGAPLTGVPVEVSGEGIRRVLESGMSGIFRVAGLLPGRYEVRPFPFRGAFGRPTTVALEEGVTECNVGMDSVTERRIRVLDERGHPVAKAHVASAIDGERCAVAVADQEGYASLRVAPSRTDWEVRSTDTLQALPVREFQAEAGAVVVALP